MASLSVRSMSELIQLLLGRSTDSSPSNPASQTGSQVISQHASAHKESPEAEADDSRRGRGQRKVIRQPLTGEVIGFESDTLPGKHTVFRKPDA